MSRFKQLRYRIGGVAAVVGVSVLVAACGGGGSSATTTAASGGSAATTPATTSGSSNAAATATPTSAKGVSISTTKGKEGTFLTGAGGRALYLWVADAKGMSSCSGACAKAWPPLTTHGKPIAGNGVTSSDLGTIKRSDGSTQVTYNGHPLYYFAGDSGSGTTNGQGSTAFGAPWWVVSPSGTAITNSGAGAAASSSSSSSSSSSGGGGSSSWS